MGRDWLDELRIYLGNAGPGIPGYIAEEIRPGWTDLTAREAVARLKQGLPPGTDISGCRALFVTLLRSDPPAAQAHKPPPAAAEDPPPAAAAWFDAVRGLLGPDGADIRPHALRLVMPAWLGLTPQDAAERLRRDLPKVVTGGLFVARLKREPPASPAALVWLDAMKAALGPDAQDIPRDALRNAHPSWLAMDPAVAARWLIADLPPHVPNLTALILKRLRSEPRRPKYIPTSSEVAWLDAVRGLLRPDGQDIPSSILADVMPIWLHMDPADAAGRLIHDLPPGVRDMTALYVERLRDEPGEGPTRVRDENTPDPWTTYSTKPLRDILAEMFG
jgi:hypothetical protein